MKPDGLERRFGMVGGLLLLIGGVACLAWAAVSVYRSASVEMGAPGGMMVEAGPESEDAAAAETEEATEGSDLAASSAAAGDADQGSASRPEERSVASGGTSAARTKEAARREAWVLWLTLVLILLLVLLTGGLVIVRRVRPKPMSRHGPTDTTDLWQEAGKRLKL